MLSLIKERRANFIKALATYTGTILGVGIFGLPYVAMKAGFFVVVVYFILVSILSIIISKLYGDLCCDTQRLARTAGYAEEYFGHKTKKFSFIISSLVLVGALLAYLIVGGDFLYLLMKNIIGGPPLIYALFFFAIGALFIYKGIKGIAQLEFIMLVIFFIILFFFLFKAVPFINFNYFLTFDPRLITFPFGVIIFALSGLPMVPEVKEMVNRDRVQLKRVIVWGTIISAITYLIFIFSFLGTTGPQTSENAISGFAALIGPGVLFIGYAFGLITTFTSFITLGLTLRKMLNYDFSISKRLSWFLACFVPLFIYFLGVKNFLDVIGLTGAIVLGIESGLIIFIYRSFIRRRFQRHPPWWIFLLLFCLAVGVAFQIIYFFIR